MSRELVPAPADPRGVMQLAMWTETSLALPEGLPFEDWQAIGQVLGRAERSVQWWMGDWWRYGEHAYGERAAQALDSRWSFQTWADAGWVASAIGTSRRREVLSFSHHKEVAALNPDEQDRWLDAAETEGWTRNDLRSEIRRARASLVAAATFLPAGKYAVLLADPPWQYDFVEADNRAIENQYPTLTADEIACYEDATGRPIADLPADDAVLYLWATNPKLTEAVRVMEGWGFRYVTNLVWVKDRVGMGYWARQRHELVLIGVRGHFSPPPEHLRPDSVIEAPRTGHSVKPLAIHDLIDSVWPGAPKVEVFGRATREGWAVFGNDPKVA